MAQDDIQGQVVDAQGNPVSGAIVELTRSFESNPVEEQTVLRTTTDSNGNYIFESHPDGDGTTQDYHVSCYNHDGGAYVNSFNNPGVTADLSTAIPDSGTNQWPVDEGSGAALNPRLGSVTASITGATWESDASAIGGQRLGFNGTDNRVETDSPVGATEAQATVFGWVRPLDYTAYDNSLFSSGPDPGVSAGGGWYIDTEDTDGEILSAFGQTTVHNNVPFVSSGDWGFVALIIDGTTVRLITWSNSSELADVTATAGSRANADNTLIVGDTNGSGSNAEMSADIFGVADGVALSKADLTEFWKATKR